MDSMSPTKMCGNFYPRPPRGGRLPDLAWHYAGALISIHALREEGDLKFWAKIRRRANFYPRPPRGGRLGSLAQPMRPSEFLSTPSARRATLQAVLVHNVKDISIHALREEGDRYPGGDGSRLGDFYPRPPRGGRPTPVCAAKAAALFLSTPSARRATLLVAESAGF